MRGREKFIKRNVHMNQLRWDVKNVSIFVNYVLFNAFEFEFYEKFFGSLWRNRYQMLSTFSSHAIEIRSDIIANRIGSHRVGSPWSIVSNFQGDNFQTVVWECGVQKKIAYCWRGNFKFCSSDRVNRTSDENLCITI